MFGLKKTPKIAKNKKNNTRKFLILNSKNSRVVTREI